MKTKLLIALCFSFVSYITVNAQWLQQTSMSSASLTGIHCLTVDTCFCVGANGNIRKTVNGGTNWSVIASGTFTNIASVKMYNSSKIWAGLVNGTFRYSSNGGGAWSTIVGNTTHVINDIDFLNDSDYVAVGGSATNTATGGYVFDKTINAGSSWSPINVSGEPTMFGIHCFNDTHFVAVGGAMTIYETDDGGASWWKNDSGASTTVLYDVHFPTDSVGYAVGGNPANPTTGGIVLVTSDTGMSWDTIIMPDLTVWYGVHFVNNDTGFVVGAGGKILNTIDGGMNWTTQTSPVTTTLNKIQMLNDSVGYISGASGVILKTIDGGGYLTTSVHESMVSETGFVIYGNPSHSQMMIETGAELKNAELTIVNSLGQQVEMKKNISGNIIYLNISDYARGVYFFRLTDENKNAAGKFVVE